jgi:lactate dehydrogenase-like 2-hydroxyacid dehydrogenase
MDLRIPVLIPEKIYGGLTAMAGEHFELCHMDQAPDRDVFLRETGPKIRGMFISAASKIWLGDEFLAIFPALEVVSIFGVGYNFVDLAAAGRRGVAVLNTPGVLTDCVADLGFGLLMALGRRIPEADAHVRSGGWRDGVRFPLSHSLRGRTLGIAGMGAIGSAVARRAEPFGLAVRYHSRTDKNNGLPFHGSMVSLARESDFLMLCLPGNQETRDLVGREVLEALGPDGYLINIARGSVVDHAALAEALGNRTIAGAALDVFPDEPNVPDGLAGLGNVILTPHMASATLRTFGAMAGTAVSNMVNYFEGAGPVFRVV